MSEEQANYQQIRRKLRKHLADLFDTYAADERERLMDRTAMAAQLRQALNAAPGGVRLSTLSPADQERLVNDLVDEVVGIGPLEFLLVDESVTEIMVNGPDEIFVEREGKIQRIDAAFRDTAHLMSVIERMLGSVHASVNEASPICDASLADGTRMNVIIPPAVLNGPVVTIRRKMRDWTMVDYISKGALTPQAAEFLEACVRAKVNMIISGGTSTGKTTLVSILATFIPPKERVITIENVPELELPCTHWIRVVGRSANIEGRGEIPLRALVRNALRMRPDRIILGEARGGEALDVVQAMHSGHDGFMTVLHANSAYAALERLETLMLMSGLDLSLQACRVQIASATDLVIHLSRLIDGSRNIQSITQVTGVSQEGFQMEDLFVYDIHKASSYEEQPSGVLRYTGARPRFLRKFQLTNIRVPAWLNVSAPPASQHPQKES